MYAHYLFNAFDTTNNGSIKFKVKTNDFMLIMTHTIASTYSLNLSSVSLLPGLCHGFVHTAARNPERKARVDVSPVRHQQRRLHKQRGETGPSLLEWCFVCHLKAKFHRSVNLLLLLSGDDWDRESHLWHDGQVHLPCAKRRRPPAACGRLFSG